MGRSPPDPDRVTIVCDVSRILEPDLATVDALARMQIHARRVGCRIVVGRAPGRLVELIELMGLRETLGLEPLGEAEQREQALGVEEEGDSAEAVAGDLEDLQ